MIVRGVSRGGGGQSPPPEKVYFLSGPDYPPPLPKKLKN